MSSELFDELVEGGADQMQLESSPAEEEEVVDQIQEEMIRIHDETIFEGDEESMQIDASCQDEGHELDISEGHETDISKGHEIDISKGHEIDISKGHEIDVSKGQEIDISNFDLENQRLTGMCRVCAKTKAKLIPVFGGIKKPNQTTITEKIHSFLPILVTPEDLLPVSICPQCLSRLDQSQKLVETCLQADKKLRELLETKLKESAEVKPKSEVDDDDYCGGCDDDDFDRPPTPASPEPTRNTSPPLTPIITKVETVAPEPPPEPRAKSPETPSTRVLRRPRAGPKSRSRRSNLFETTPADNVAKDPRKPNILRRSTRQSVQENLSPSILEKMRSCGIKEASVVMTKVDIPHSTSSTVVTTVSVPITKEKPKSRSGPRRLYRCLYCSETGSDAYKLLLHQMKMHPGNLLNCPHCSFVCGSDQRARYDAHVLAHASQGKILVPLDKTPPASQDKILVPLQKTAPASQGKILLPVEKTPPEVIDISTDPAPIQDPSPNRDTPRPLGVNRVNVNAQFRHVKPKSLLKLAPNNKPVPIRTTSPIVTKIPGNAIMLRIPAEGKTNDKSKPAPTAIIPVTLYQCARCRMNFNTKEGVENHVCVVNLVPIAPKPGNLNFPCATCGKIFNDSSLLREHVLTHYQTFKCDTCGTSFRSEFHLRQHARKHNPEKQIFKCPHEGCPKEYSLKSRLQVHLHSHSSEPRCVCPQCGKVFRTDGGYRNHIKAHENHRAFACSVCGLRFNRRGNMRRHERNCDGKKTLTCRYCMEKFDRHDDLLVHRAQVHADIEVYSPIIPDVSTGNKEKRYTCKVCSEGFYRVMELRKHQLDHSEEDLNKVKDVPDGGAYLCHTCGKQLHHKHNYKLHMMHHQGKALFKCSSCDRTFTSKFALNYHMMLHTGDFPYKCSLCSESFRSSVALQVHRFKHTGEKPYRCRSCEMGFFTPHSLRLHQVVHQTERNYVCRVCGSTFKRRKTLQYHSLIHTGEKPHKCRICGKAFRQKGTCTIHERNHSSNRDPASTRKLRSSTVAMRERGSEEDEEVEEEEEEGEEEEMHSVDMAEGDVEMEENVEEVMEEELEERIEEEIETTEVDERTETSPPQAWRQGNGSKIQFRLKNLEWKHPSTSQVNEAIFVLRETEGMKEGLPEVCSVQTEALDNGLLSMYPEIPLNESMVVSSEKPTIEFTTPDGTIRIIQ